MCRLIPPNSKRSKNKKKHIDEIETVLQHARKEAISKAEKTPKKKNEYFQQFTKQTQEVFAKNIDQKFLDESKTKFTQERLNHFHQWIYESKKPLTSNDILSFVIQFFYEFS
ncbi:hypothetical protein [Helicobacter pylori]|uniref:hypothetical protein n=1 Tax=Helicobacter pylori TaxID=210 RepID=UPI00273A3925|nr:hypothetical protein [Helicobacter pylori]